MPARDGMPPLALPFNPAPFAPLTYLRQPVKPPTAVVRRPSSIAERREIPLLDMEHAIERRFEYADGGRLLIPIEPTFLQTRAA